MKLEIKESILLGDKILREEVTIGEMIDPNFVILIGYLSHRMVEQEDSIRNVRIPNQDMVNMIEINQEIEVNGQSPQGKNKERKRALLACAAIVRREGSNWITQV